MAQFKRVIGCVLLLILAEISFALDQMGAPRASLKKGQFDISALYSHSEMFLDAHENAFFESKLKIDKYAAAIGYGIEDNWNIYIISGASNLKKNYHPDPEAYSADTFNADGVFLYGLGTKATFFQAGKWSFGGLAQITGLSDIKERTDHIFYGESIPEADPPKQFYHSIKHLIEVQFAVGPTYQISENILIYGGPFVHLVRGDYSRAYYLRDGSSGDLITTSFKEEDSFTEKSLFGIYLGIEFNLVETLSASLEYQHTAEADAIGGSLIFRF